MSNIRNFSNIINTKPGARYTIVRDQERKERELNKYLNTCQLYKLVNPEQKPKRSELIEQMYEEKKVMRTRTSRRNGAKGFNFKKQSASRVINNNKLSHKGNTSKNNSTFNYKRGIEEIEQNYYEDY